MMTWLFGQLHEVNHVAKEGTAGLNNRGSMTEVTN
jgi:hypothetical protein